MAVPVIEAANSHAASTSATATVEFELPAGVVEGELIVLIGANDNHENIDQFDGTTNFPSGYTFVTDSGNATSDCHIGLFWKIAGASETTTFTSPFTSAASENCCSWAFRISGADATAPIEVLGAETNNQATTTVAGEITTLTADSLAMCAMAYQGGDSTHTVSGTGWTGAYFNQFASSAAVASGYAKKDMATAGATGDITWTHSVIDGSTAFQFAIKPAAAAGGRTVDATAATMTLADINATLNLKRELASTLAAMGMTTAAATIATGRSIDTSLATIAATDLNATAITNRELNSTLGTMSAATLAASLSAGLSIDASLATLTSSTNAADVNLYRQVAATLATLAGATTAADIERKRVIECTVGLLCICALKSSITGPIPPPPSGLRRALIGCVGRGATRRRGLS